jgi:hypothetical protein
VPISALSSGRSRARHRRQPSIPPTSATQQHQRRRQSPCRPNRPSTLACSCPNSYQAPQVARLSWIKLSVSERPSGQPPAPRQWHRRCRASARPFHYKPDERFQSHDLYMGSRRHRPRRRTIQYTVTFQFDLFCRGVLDAPPARSMTALETARAHPIHQQPISRNASLVITSARQWRMPLPPRASVVPAPRYSVANDGRW